MPSPHSTSVGMHTSLSLVFLNTPPSVWRELSAVRVKRTADYCWYSNSLGSLNRQRRQPWLAVPHGEPLHTISCPIPMLSVSHNRFLSAVSVQQLPFLSPAAFFLRGPPPGFAARTPLLTAAFAKTARPPCAVQPAEQPLLLAFAAPAPAPT